MEWIIKKANEIREKYGTDNIEELAQKLGAEVVEEKLGRIIKEAYFKAVSYTHLTLPTTERV